MQYITDIMERWIGKIALVTGASAGIGTAIVTKLVENGMKVVGCARNLEKLNEISSKINENGKGEMFPCQCDLSKEDEIIKMFQFIKEKFGTIHVCVNNAGLAHKATMLSGKTEDWRDMLNINVLALCITTREAIALMHSGGVDDGHVINISSISGHKVVGNVMYAASKHAVRAITEGLRKELREERSSIRITAISPGLVETEFAFRMYKDNPQFARDKYARIQCLQPIEIAETVEFVLGTPPHVEVNDMLVRPIEQQA